MTDKRVELPPIEITREDVRRASDLVTMDGSGPYYPCYPEFQCRERQLLSALTKISQLEQQLVAEKEELENLDGARAILQGAIIPVRRWSDATAKNLELALKWLQPKSNPAAAEGGIGK